MTDPSPPGVPVGSTRRTPTSENRARRQDDEASTRRVWADRSSRQSDVPPGLESVGTTERKATHFYFQRNFGHPVYPRHKDIEAQGSLEETTPSVATPGSTPSHVDEDVRVTEMEIMHNWMQDVQEENLFVATINVLKETSLQQRLSGRVFWIHLETPLPSLDYIEQIFHSRISHMLRPYVKETTISLLQRIRTECERKFVLGKYLTTDVVRYSARSVETDNKDHPCLFLNFPFLAKGDFEQPRTVLIPKRNPPDSSSRRGQKSGTTTQSQPRAPHSGVTPNDHSTTFGQKITKRFSFKSRHEIQLEGGFHPARTLFQSRYRLESTAKRDKKQAILTLPLKDMQDCIQLPKSQPHLTANGHVIHSVIPAQGRPARSSTKESTVSLKTKTAHKTQKLYIPQLWSLSLSGDIMLTCGPLSLDQLCGSELTRRDYDTTASRSRHKVVRFNVDNDFGKNEEFIYPADRCDWYFGLLNKQRKIEDILGKSAHISPVKDRKGTCSFFYALVYRKTPRGDGEVVDCDNWLEIQSQHGEDYLDVYLENRTLPVISTVILDPNPTPANSPDNGFLSPTRPAQRQAIHVRSLSAPSSSAARPEPLSPRLLLQIPNPRTSRGDASIINQTPRARSISPISFATPSRSAFFEWPFLEEINEKIKFTKEERINVWLAKTYASICKAHGQDIHANLLQDSRQSISSTCYLNKPVEGSDFEQIRSRFFFNGPAIIQDGSTIESDAAQKVYLRAGLLIKLFMPESISRISTDNTSQPSAPLIFIYWGLVLRILHGIAQKRTGDGYKPDEIVDMFQTFVDLAKRVHRGVWKMKDEMDDSKNVTLVESAIIQVPLIRAFERTFELMFTIVATMEGSKPVLATETVRSQVNTILDEYESIEDNLIFEADENRFQTNLGPIVTPESITLLLLNRLSQGVYSNGTINIIEVYEKIIERLAYKVESSSSRLLLLEISRVQEEVAIVLDTFNQQKSFLGKYKAYLNPDEITEPSLKRKTRFVHEKLGIEKLEKDVEERVQHCSELLVRIKLLAEQNLQRVEAYQEDNNNKLMLFTVVTITFLPPSFVTSFLGMNVVGVRDTNYTSTQFWKIAAPLTAGLLIPSLLILYWNFVKRMWKRLRESIQSEDEE